MIENNIKLKLVELIPKQIIGLLIANGYVTHLGGDISWDTIIVKDDTQELLNILDKKEDNNEKVIENLMQIFPKHQLDSKKALLIRYTNWLKKTDLKPVTEDEIYDAAQAWVDSKGPTFCGNLFYFFYKEENKVYKSRLDNIISQMRESDNNDIEITSTEFDVDWTKIK